MPCVAGSGKRSCLATRSPLTSVRCRSFRRIWSQDAPRFMSWRRAAPILCSRRSRSTSKMSTSPRCATPTRRRPEMLGRIFLFEIRYQLRQPLFWISAILFFLMTFGAVTTDVIVVGGSIGSVNRNAPFVLMQLLLVMTLIGTFLTTAFAAGSVYRDFESQADAIFFSLPLRKADYLFGRLVGSLAVSWLVYVAVLLGVPIGGVTAPPAPAP